MLQATAEQIRLAQMIYDKNDADFEDKVNQVSCPFSYQLLPNCNGPVALATRPIGVSHEEQK